MGFMILHTSALLASSYITLLKTCGNMQSSRTITCAKNCDLWQNNSYANRSLYAGKTYGAKSLSKMGGKSIYTHL